MKNKISHGMKKQISKIVKALPYLAIALLVGVTAVYAGNLTPPGAPAKSMKSLSDLYELVNTGANTPSTDFTTPEAVSSTMHSLGDIYDLLVNKIADIDETTILTGTTIFGIEGEATSGGGGVDLSNMYNGSCIVGRACPNGDEFPGGTQAQGGIDDANYDTTAKLTQAPPVGRYETTWTTCNVGNNYCGTGDTGANAKDEATGLVWSYPLTGLGGASWDTETDTAVLTAGCLTDGNCAYLNTDIYYSWDNSRVDNDSKTAYELCSEHTGWSLPHQKQLMQAYIDGAYGNLEPVGVHRRYWSATTSSSGAVNAWYVNLSFGFTSVSNKSNMYAVRCIRE